MSSGLGFSPFFYIFLYLCKIIVPDFRTSCVSIYQHSELENKIVKFSNRALKLKSILNALFHRLECNNRSRDVTHSRRRVSVSSAWLLNRKANAYCVAGRSVAFSSCRGACRSTTACIHPVDRVH